MTKPAGGTTSVLCIGVGNKFRGDDGIGPEIAARVAGLRPDGTRAIEQSGEGAGLMDSWKGSDAVIIIDATSSGTPPGTIHRFDAVSGPLPLKFFHYSTHAFSVAEAIELSRTLGSLPGILIVYGIEGKNFEAGSPVSPEVRKAAKIIEKKIVSDIDNILGRNP